MYLRRDTNDAASRAGTSVARLLGLGVVGLAEVVGAAVDDECALCYLCVSKCRSEEQVLWDKSDGNVRR
jgi:NAD-dependent dihydropyrimidine dehydrogenase PreA subunit